MGDSTFPVMFFIWIFLVTSRVSGLPQLFSLNVGFGSDDSPLTFFQNPTPASEPARSAPAPQRSNQNNQFSRLQTVPVPATQPTVAQTAPVPVRSPPQQDNLRESHDEALRRNELQRKQLAEVVAQHNEKTFGAGNSFSIQGDSEPQGLLTSRTIPPQTRRPQIQPQVTRPDSPKTQNHNEALQRNALHRQQLAEVIAMHNKNTAEVAETINLSEDHETQSQSRPSGHFRSSANSGISEKLQVFLAKNGSSSKKSSKKTQPKHSSSKKNGGNSRKQFEQLEDHLELLTLLESQVEDLYDMAQDVFSTENLGGNKKPHRRPALADPRRG